MHILPLCSIKIGRPARFDAAASAASRAGGGEVHMEILFINPPTQHMITTNIPEVVEQGKGVIPPLGILYVAAYLKKNTQHKIKILDLELDNKSEIEIKFIVRLI